MKDIDNLIISAFAFKTGQEIEKLIKDQTNDLQQQNQDLKAKILRWYSKTHDENFA